MGLLEGYFVPLHNFFLTPENFDQKVWRNPLTTAVGEFTIHWDQVTRLAGLMAACPLQVHNVAFSFELMQDGGLEKPKPRAEGKYLNTLSSNLWHLKAL